MHIVLDASVLITEDYGGSALMQTLLSASTALGYTVCVPRLAVSETAGKALQELERHSRTARRSLRQLTRLTGRRLESPDLDIDIDTEATSFENTLLQNLAQAGVTILPYPEVAHEELARRAISRTRPFDQKGSGYRDSLIWFSILRFASEDQGHILLVTGDNDFTDDSGKLHPDLKEDLKRNGRVGCTLAVFKSLKQAIDKNIRPKLAQVFWQDPLSTLAHFEFDVRVRIASAIENAYGQHVWQPHELGLPPECVNPHIADVAQADIYEVVDVRQLPDHRFSVTAKAEVIGLYGFSLYARDLNVIVENPGLAGGTLGVSTKGAYVETDMLMRAVVELSVHEFNPDEHRIQVVSLNPWD